MSYRRLAALLMPADSTCAAEVLDADEWSLSALSSVSVDVVIWGRRPTKASPIGRVLRQAVEREQALLNLRRRSGWTVAAVHRWNPSVLRHSPARNWFRSRLRQGAAVELSRVGRYRRVLDDAARAAGCEAQVGNLHVATDGSVLARVSGDRLLRIGSGVSDAAAASIELLARLEEEGIGMVPRRVTSGSTDRFHWSVETLLPGRRPVQSSPGLEADLARWCAALPVADAATRAPLAKLGRIGERFPAWAELLEDVGSWMMGAVGLLPSIVGHGDLWRGNLLVSGGRLSGVVDWDAGHVEGVPGADLLHYVAQEEAIREERALGEIWKRRPWRGDRFEHLSRRYWLALGLRPTPDTLEAIGLAWWATAIDNSLTRLPHLADDEQWLARNVFAVLDAVWAS